MAQKCLVSIFEDLSVSIYTLAAEITSDINIFVQVNIDKFLFVLCHEVVMHRSI